MMIEEPTYEKIPFDKAIRSIQDWNPEIQTVTELKMAYWSALDDRNKRSENKELIDWVYDYKRYSSKYRVKRINQSLSKCIKNVINSNWLIAVDYNGDCMLHFGIDKEGRLINHLYYLLPIEEIKNRLYGAK